ncbi:MAG: hypothetical protein QF412_14260 [Planctomycetota bacterium]|nr:hypothetical protein [Planctomycetota bacterium]
MYKSICFMVVAFAVVTGTVFGQGGGGAGAARGSVELIPTSQLYADIDVAPSPSFRRHVMTLMSRNGCSGRECHGSFQGRGGFSLSLFGYDFAKDHKEIVADPDDDARVDLENPEQSLVLLKPTMQKKHKGKLRFEKESWEYNLILKWIRSGADLEVDSLGRQERCGGHRLLRSSGGGAIADRFHQGW